MWANPSGRKVKFTLDTQELLRLRDSGLSFAAISASKGVSEKVIRDRVNGRKLIRKTDAEYIPRENRRKRVADHPLKRGASVLAACCPKCGTKRNKKWFGAKLGSVNDALCRSCSQSKPRVSIENRKRSRSEVTCPSCGLKRLVWHRNGYEPLCVKCFHKTIDHRKEKHPGWKGGVSAEAHLIRTSIPYRKWQTEVYKRDKYTCQICGLKKQNGRSFHAHHIKPFATHPELRIEISNGVSLCKLCHEQIVHRGDCKAEPIPWDEIKMLVEQGVLTVDWHGDVNAV